MPTGSLKPTSVSISNYRFSYKSLARSTCRYPVGLRCFWMAIILADRSLDDSKWLYCYAPCFPLPFAATAIT